jgi:peptidoglycan/xylan/chitin deacetylase (PgdA/CDA1 family)
MKTRHNIQVPAFKIAMRVCYYSGVLKLFNFFSAKFQPKKYPEGKVVFPFVQRKRARNLQILVYHRVNDQGDSFFPAVPMDQFAAQMEYLAANCFPCPLEEAVQRLKHNDLPERAVVVTFDDGYRDNYQYAWPILRRFRIPATIFLAAGAIGSGRIWHERVFRAFRTTQAVKLERFPDRESSYPLTSLEARLNAQSRALRFLWELTDEERLRWINRLEERLGMGDPGESEAILLGWDEISVMSESGVSFGSHTISHPILSKSPEEKLKEEIEGSKKIIENKIKRAVSSFAYPVGRKQDFNDRVKAMVKEAGYQCALTTVFGVNEPGQDLFELRRGTPWESDIPSFAAKLSWYRFVANE